MEIHLLFPWSMDNTIMLILLLSLLLLYLTITIIIIIKTIILSIIIIITIIITTTYYSKTCGTYFSKLLPPRRCRNGRFELKCDF